MTERFNKRKQEIYTYIENVELPDILSQGDCYTFYENVKELDVIGKILDILDKMNSKKLLD